MLPKIEKPTFLVTLPSTKRPVRFRMMTRREEKVLLIAKESEPSDRLEAVRQVLINCAADNLDVDSLPIFDAEYAFIMIRACSMGSLEKVSYIDNDDHKEYDCEVDLTKVEVVFPENSAKTIETGDIKIQLCYPTVAAWSDAAVVKAATLEDTLDALAVHCIDKIWVKSAVYAKENISPEQIKEFLDDLDLKSWDQIRSHLINLPHLSYWVSWVNSNNIERKVELRELQDFFSFS